MPFHDHLVASPLSDARDRDSVPIQKRKVLVVRQRLQIDIDDHPLKTRCPFRRRQNTIDLDAPHISFRPRSCGEDD